MEPSFKPKNRRKNYRYFQNFDILKFNEDWFIRFPNEREHIYLGRERAKRFDKLLMQEYRDAQNSSKTIFMDGVPIVKVSVPMDARNMAVIIAKQLLQES